MKKLKTFRKKKEKEKYQEGKIKEQNEENEIKQIKDLMRELSKTKIVRITNLKRKIVIINCLHKYLTNHFIYFVKELQSNDKMT